MNVDPLSLGDLLARMREVAEAGAADSASVDGASGVGQTAPASAAEALSEALRTTAARALRGEFDTALQLRSAVAEQIVRSRWANTLGEPDLSAVIGELTPSLATDPEFGRQVDEMLLLAAAEIGRP